MWKTTLQVFEDTLILFLSRWLFVRLRKELTWYFFHVLFYCVWFFSVSSNLCIRLRLPSPSRHVHHYQNCSITNWKCCQSCFLFVPFAKLGSVDELLKIVHFSFSSDFFFTCSSERVLLIFVVRNYSTSLSAISPKRWRSSLFGAEK